MPQSRLIETNFAPTGLPNNASLFLDFDGTLVELADRPEDVVASPRVRNMIMRGREHLVGRIAIITGRSAAFVIDQIGRNDIVIAGSHGQEIYFGEGRWSAPEPLPALKEIAHRLQAETHDDVGILVEHKPLGVALHYRMAPHKEDFCKGLAETLAREHGLLLQHGKMMVELRAAGGDKGSAVRRLLLEQSFKGSIPVFIGDDLTDEGAFEAVAEAGGFGILVGAPRATAALYRLESVDAVLTWLEREFAA